jgi:AraC-like DNA-binding protein
MLRAAFEQAKPGPWLRRHSIQLASPSARQVLWAIGRRVAQNPDLGFVIAQGVSEEAVGSLWPLYRAAPSLRALTARYDTWSPLLLDFASFRPFDEENITWFRTTPPAHLTLDRGEQDFRTSMTIKYWRTLSRDPQLTPRAVHFTYARPNTLAWHQRVLGDAALRFRQPHFQIGLLREQADAPLPGADLQTYERLAQAAAASAADVGRRGSLLHRVEALITQQLAAAPQVRDVSSALGLSERTLRRQLAERGATFRTLLARVREREYELYARALLSTAETARHLGFANRGALNNGLRRVRSAVSPAMKNRR